MKYVQLVQTEAEMVDPQLTTPSVYYCEQTRKIKYFPSGKEYDGVSTTIAEWTGGGKVKVKTTDNLWHENMASPLTPESFEGTLNYILANSEEDKASLVTWRYINCKPKTCNMAFYYWTSLTEVDVTGLDLSECEDMNMMFCNATSLSAITGIANLDVSNVDNLGYVFMGCTSLETLDLSGWDTSNCNMTSSMFSSCENLRELKLGKNFVIAEPSYNSQFWHCYSLEHIILHPDTAQDRITKLLEILEYDGFTAEYVSDTHTINCSYNGN